MAYSLSNIRTKDYWNQTVIVIIIYGDWVVLFFLRHSVVYWTLTLLIVLCMLFAGWSQELCIGGVCQ